MSDFEFTPGPASSPAPRSEPRALPERDPENASEISRLKLGFAFVAGLVVGVGACLVLYFISPTHPLPPGSSPASDPAHAEPLKFERNDGAASASVSVPDATLSLLPVTTEEQPGEQSIKHFTLHIPIKARPGSHIAVRDMVVQVLFYDLVNDQTVVQTSANVNTHWVDPPADWSKSDTEGLAVEYDLPKPTAGSTKPDLRKYYGYLVRIYYRNQLQAATASPERLQRQYPPPPILPK